MDDEQVRSFNDRLSQWVANQGFWFQMRHSFGTSGLKGRATYAVLRMAGRLAVFLLIAALGCLYYLSKRTDSPSFSQDLQGGLQGALGASKLEIRGANSMQGRLEIRSIAARGENGSFFKTIEARNVRLRMGLLDGLVGTWKTQGISAARADIEFRAGADDEESAVRLGDSLFRKPEGFEADQFTVDDATLRWGYSAANQGRVEKSRLSVSRIADGAGWRISLKGGTFSQNWIRGFEIRNIEAVLDRDGLVFERAELESGGGTIDFSGLRVSAGARPVVKGSAVLRNVQIARILPAAFSEYIDGSFSGNFQVSGSTNDSAGISFEGQVALDGTDTISIRERIGLLRALSIVDYSRNYHRLDFREGSFDLKTGGGGILVSNMRLSAFEAVSDEGKSAPSVLLFAMRGAFRTRLPTEEEKLQSLEMASTGEESSMLPGDDSSLMGTGPSSDFTLRKAGELTQGQGGADESATLVDEIMRESSELRQLRLDAADRASRSLRYEGGVVVSIPGDAFERSPVLRSMHPVDPNTGRIEIEVPINGELPNVTRVQAEDLNEKGRRFFGTN
jgi:hypothetical protein